MATLDEAGNLTLYDFASLKPLARVRCEASPYYLVQGFGLKWSAGNLIAAHYAVGILLFDAETLKPHSRWQSSNYTQFAFMAGGRWLVRAGNDIIITDIETDSTVLHVPPRWNTEFCDYTHLAADPSGDTVLFVDDGGYEDIGMATEGPFNPKELTLLQVPSKRVLQRQVFEQGGGVSLLSFDPWRGHYWVLNYGGSLEFWDKDGNGTSQGPLSGQVLGVGHSQRWSVVLRRNEPKGPVTVLLW
jgi:hypothetical protein